MPRKKKAEEDTSKSAEEKYAESLIDEDSKAGPTFEMTETEADASPSEETEPETQEPQPPDVDAVIQQAEADRLARERMEGELKKVQREYESIKELMAMTVQQANQQAGVQQTQKAEEYPQWFDNDEAAVPGTRSYNFLKQREREEMRQAIRQEVRQELQQDKQRTIMETQIEKLKEKHPDASDEWIKTAYQKYSKPGTVTLEMIWDWEHRQEDIQHARKEGIQDISKQVERVSRPSIAATAGKTERPKKLTEEDKADQYADSILDLNEQDLARFDLSEKKRS